MICNGICSFSWAGMNNNKVMARISHTTRSHWTLTPQHDRHASSIHRDVESFYSSPAIQPCFLTYQTTLSPGFPLLLVKFSITRFSKLFIFTQPLVWQCVRMYEPHQPGWCINNKPVNQRKHVEVFQNYFLQYVVLCLFLTSAPLEQ